MPASEPSTTTTTTTTSTTTTPRPTTPGVCSEDCDLAGTIKLVGGAKWVPELLDHNTKEWQLLANEVQTQVSNIVVRPNLFAYFLLEVFFTTLTRCMPASTGF